jgi:hypothetical protein
MTAQPTLSATLPTSTARFVSRVLLSNAAFGVVCGVICLVWARPLAAAFGGAPPMILTVLGVGLLLFAAELAWIAHRMPENRRVLTIIFALDVAWVIASALLLLAGWIPFTPGGTWTVILVADVVAVFAVLEFIGLRRMRG